LRSISDKLPPRVLTFFSPSDSLVVGHPASATVLRLLSLFPASLLPFCASVPAIGVGQPASVAAPSRSIPPVWVAVDFAFGPPLGVFGVGQPASHATRPNRAFSGTFTSGLPPSFQSLVVVGQPAIAATSLSVTCTLRPSGVRPVALVPSGGVCPPDGVVGLGHPVQSLSDMRRADARRAGIRRPDGVALSFQVRLYKVEPTETVRARYLFAKDDCRAELPDEMEPGGP
jgi:hypothetical protein